MLGLEDIQARVLIAATEVRVKPDPSGVPGEATIQKLVNGGAWLAMLFCLGGFLLGAAQWAWGSKSHNYSQASSGRDRMLYGACGAFAVGAAAAIINFFFDAGTGVR